MVRPASSKYGRLQPIQAPIQVAAKAKQQYAATSVFQDAQSNIDRTDTTKYQ